MAGWVLNQTLLLDIQRRATVLSRCCIYIATRIALYCIAFIFCYRFEYMPYYMYLLYSIIVDVEMRDVMCCVKVWYIALLSSLKSYA